MIDSHISPTGLSVLSEPETGEIAVDIVFVHGLQGHPYKTWASKRWSDGEQRFRATTSSNRGSSPMQLLGTGMMAQPIRQIGNHDDDGEGDVFWPQHFLPSECPKARILTWGYDSKVIKSLATSTNKSGIYSHAKNLLFELSRNRPLDRRLIFVAHSLGGIITKEVLASSSASADREILNIVQFTSAVVFLGTPHRGSKSKAKVGDVVRKFVGSALRLDTSPLMLDVLGLKNSDLERVQEGFSRAWNKYDFRVKTFQEGLGLTGVKFGMLNEMVVPSHSSLLGDSREKAEVLQANHMDMVRFGSPDDPNYRKVAGELRVSHDRIVALDESIRQATTVLREPPSSSARPFGIPLPESNRACLGSLRFPGIDFHQRTIKKPVKNSYGWLSANENYNSWRGRRSVQTDHGLLRITGKPGCGKSTLVKEAFQKIPRTTSLGPSTITAAFFFNAKGGKLERSQLGMFRSLLYQILLQHPGRLSDLVANFEGKQQEHLRDVEWTCDELGEFFESTFEITSTPRTVIFVDGLDEAGTADARKVARFFRQLTTSAYKAGVELDVCLSSRHSPSITLDACPEIALHRFNGPDIVLYVERELNLGGLGGISDSDERLLRQSVIDKSEGVFLWTVLVVDTLLQDLDDGKNLMYLLERLHDVPPVLDGLFRQLLQEIPPENAATAVRLFQWAALAMSPLRLREWHHILAFSMSTVPKSLKEWRDSPHCTGNDDQLEKQIRALSKGLIEVVNKPQQRQSSNGFPDYESQRAFAGSLNSEYGDTRLVQVIHESVREFFKGEGFSLLDPSLSHCPVGLGHLGIINTCLNCLHIRELDNLVQARKWREGSVKSYHSLDLPALESRNANEAKAFTRQPLKRSSSVASFSSAGSAFSASHQAAEAKKRTKWRKDTEPLGDTMWHENIWHRKAWQKDARRANSWHEDVRRENDAWHEDASHESAWRHESESDCLCGDPLSEVQEVRAELMATLHKSSTSHQKDMREELQRPSLFASSDVVPPEQQEEEPAVVSSRKEVQMINNWLAALGPDCLTDYPQSEAATSHSSAPRTGHPRILSDFPAVLHYALKHVFMHARIADESGADPSAVVLRFLDRKTWKRWLRLGEELPEDTSLMKCAALYGLISWVRCLLEMGVDPYDAFAVAADMGAGDGHGWTPLLVAARYGHEANGDGEDVDFPIEKPSRLQAPREQGVVLPAIFNDENSPTQGFKATTARQGFSPTSSHHRVPPPLPPPRYVPVYRYDTAAAVEKYRRHDHDAIDKLSHYKGHFERDEGYHSLESPGGRDGFGSARFHMHHAQFQFRSSDAAYDRSLLRKLDSRRTTDNRSPPRPRDAPVAARAIDRLPMLPTLTLPTRARPQPMLDSPSRNTETPLHAAVFPHGTSFVNIDSRPPHEHADPDQSPMARTRKTDSDSVPDGVTLSAQGSYEANGEDVDFPIEETSRLQDFYIGAGPARPGGSPMRDEPSSDLLRKRESLSRSPPTVPRPSVIPQGSISSMSSAGRRNSHMSNPSFTASSMTSMDSFGPRQQSPGGISPSGVSLTEVDLCKLPCGTPISPTTSPRSLVPRTWRHRTLSEQTRVLMLPRKVAETRGTVFICDCCPKKPKKFDTAEELSAHEAEKQYKCSFCGNRFKNQNEVERHQNSLHVRAHSWSCSALSGYDRAFHESTSRPGDADTCGYCGEEFLRSGHGGRFMGKHLTPQDWEERTRHLQDVHKFRECNWHKKFYRADHFRQHLKHSHAGASGKWMDILENACMLEEEPPVPS